MVVLKHLNLNYRVKASTLIETLVATVLIVVVFMIASMILNNLFSNSVKSNTRAITAHLNELEYLHKNNKLELPYYDDFKLWDITIEHQKKYNKHLVQFEANHTKTNQTITKTSIEN